MELNWQLKSITYSDRCWCRAVLNKDTVCDYRVRLEMTMSQYSSSFRKNIKKIILRVQNDSFKN